MKEQKVLLEKSEIASEQFLAQKLAVFKRIFPQETIKSMVRMQGAEHYVVEINETWMCKISKDATSTALAIEKDILCLLHGALTASIPTVHYYEPNLLVYKKIPGNELTIEGYNACSPEQQRALAVDIATFLYELHAAVSVSDAAKIGVPENNWPWHAPQLYAHAHLIKDSVLQELFNKRVSVYERLSQSPQRALIHNDMIIRNIIIDPSTAKLSGVIDFTDCVIDNPLRDLRINYMSIMPLSEAVAQHYSVLSHQEYPLEQIYTDYIATELSRYIQSCVSGDQAIMKIARERVIVADQILKEKGF